MSDPVQSLTGAHIMKTNRILLLALIVSALLAVSVEAGDRHRNDGRSRSSTQSSSSGSSFRSSNARTIGSSQHFSSMGVRSAPTSFRQRSTFNSGGNVASFNQRQFTPRTFN